MQLSLIFENWAALLGRRRSSSKEQAAGRGGGRRNGFRRYFDWNTVGRRCQLSMPIPTLLRTKRQNLFSAGGPGRRIRAWGGGGTIYRRARPRERYIVARTTASSEKQSPDDHGVDPHGDSQCNDIRSEAVREACRPGGRLGDLVPGALDRRKKKRWILAFISAKSLPQ